MKQKRKVKCGSVPNDIKDKVKDIIHAIEGTRKGIKPQSRKILESIGSKVVKTLTVVRRPLPKVISLLVKLANFNLLKPSHDQLFHLFLVYEYDDGKKYILEKNEEINIEEYSLEKNDDVRQLTIKLPYTMNGMINTTIKKVGEEAFYHYSAFSDNCQKFVFDVLRSNHVYMSNEIQKFILQDVKNLVPEWAKKIVNVGTDIVNRIDIIREGGKKKRKGGVYKPYDSKEEGIARMRTLLNNARIPKDDAEKFIKNEQADKIKHGLTVIRKNIAKLKKALNSPNDKDVLDEYIKYSKESFKTIDDKLKNMIVHQKDLEDDVEFVRKEVGNNMNEIEEVKKITEKISQGLAKQDEHFEGYFEKLLFIIKDIYTGLKIFKEFIDKQNKKKDVD